MDKELLVKLGKLTGGAGASLAMVLWLHNIALAKIDKAVDQISLNKTDIAVLKTMSEDIKELKNKSNEIQKDIKDLLRRSK